MSEKPPESVLGSLPRTRPHRRSAKRAPVADAAATSAPPAEVESAPAPARTTAKAKTSAKTKTSANAKTGAKAKTAAKAAPARTKAKTTAAAKTKTTAKAKAPASRASAKAAPAKAGSGHRSLQSATAPRPDGASRKPGATSQVRRAAPPPPEPSGALGTAVQAAAELTEIGLKASARALRGALTRLPRR